ncbi:uncharacterized protein LOC132759002 [Ruditapes philippinarum]|uniref:uncharacterized protein LOC132759002 n=1 Tax=Ruditapes philippinarum TaxID=129788 RepID=UPI00295AE000|nr:uncharacterized protein LOC132759002 [Ruditapes philippinarum]
MAVSGRKQVDLLGSVAAGSTEDFDHCCEPCLTTGQRVADGNEFDDVMKKLDEKLKEASEISKKAKSSRSNINDYNKEIIKAITEFRKEINDRLDLMQKDALNNAEEIKSNTNKIIQHVLDKCENMISGIKCLQSSLHASKSTYQDGQLYIDMKRAESTLKSDELIDAEQTLLHTNMHYSFQRNAELETLFCKKMVFGCAVLNTNKLVLADYTNHKVKLISIENRLVKDEKALDSAPCDIAVMSQEQFAVTMPVNKEIVVMTTDDKLSCVRSIKVDRPCYGIDFNQDRLYVACLYPPSVIVLNTQGDILNDIPLNVLSNYFFPYIAVGKDSKLLYINDRGNNSVVSVSLQGDVIATYTHTDLREPQGMLMLDDGSLLVCCFSNGTIHKVNGDLKQGKIMYKGEDEDRLQSICYSSRYAEIYVGCIGDQLKVFNTQ